MTLVTTSPPRTIERRVSEGEPWRVVGIFREGATFQSQVLPGFTELGDAAWYV